MSERVVIVGAGHAGFHVAEALRRQQYAGEIVLVGDEPHLPYQRPPLSKGFLTGDYDLARLHLRPQTFYSDNNITLKLGEAVTAIDPRAGTVALAGGHVISFDYLVLATGSRMRQLDIPGHDLRNIFYLRTHDDAARLSGALPGAMSVAIVGGGFIGLEVASIARKFGKRCAVLEMAGRLMARSMPPRVSGFFEKTHRNRGVDIRLGTAVTGFGGDAGKVVSVCADGEEIPADLVLVGIGVVPATELAEDAGLECDNGIVVDEFARTNAGNVFAVGDCTNHFNPWASSRLRLESVQHAVDQARTAAASIAGKADPYRAVPWFWSDQYDIKLQIAGIADSYGDEVLRGDPETAQFSAFYYSGEDLRAVYSINRAGDHMAARRLLGAGRTLPRDIAADAGADLKPYIR